LTVVRIATTIAIAAPVTVVWQELADLGSHHEWMTDAESIEFTSEQRAGVGTRMRVITKVGPLRTTDVMEIIEWEEPRLIVVRHEGRVAGVGRFELTPAGGGTRLAWQEDLTLPGGPIAGFLARPVLTAVWRRNLGRLRARVES
jgi:carbon monoxide dehydrogenase subunit G